MRRFEVNSPYARDIAAVLHPNTNLRRLSESGPSIFTRGEGIHIFDDTGKSYIEGAAGLWCASLGFGNERLARVAYDAMKDFGFYHIFRGASNLASIELCERLLDIAPVPMSKVFLQCSGSEANDTAVKLVWYYWDGVGKPGKRKIIARDMGYHGTTAITSCLTGKSEFHAGYGLPLAGFLHTAFPHYYQYATDGETEEQFSERMARKLEELILAEGPETIGAFWAEPVMGSGGAVLPPRGYFAKIQAVLRKYDILLVADEVICGFGRTGEMWGSERFALQPDMVSCAKALSAAMQPISALMINERVYQVLLSQSDKRGSFIHGFTYSGHPVAAAVALETLKIYQEMDIVNHVKRLETVFLGALEELRSHALIGDVRGCGLLGGLEFVADKASRKHFPAERGVPGRIEAHARKNGLLVRFIGNRIALSPPLIIKPGEIREMVARLKAALDQTLSELT